MRQGKRVQGRRRPAEKKKQEHMEKKVNRLFLQLIASALLFLLVFVGGRLIPDRFCDVFAEVGQTIRAESMLLDSVQALGDAVAEGESLGSALKAWCVETFLPAREGSTVQASLDQHLDMSAQFHRHLLPELTLDAG